MMSFFRSLFGRKKEMLMGYAVPWKGKYFTESGVPLKPPLRPSGLFPIIRFPKYPLGISLARGGMVGVVDSIYADFYGAVDSIAVREDWWEAQEDKPSSKLQVFYGVNLYRRKGEQIVIVGAALWGENDVELSEVKGE